MIYYKSREYFKNSEKCTTVKSSVPDLKSLITDPELQIEIQEFLIRWFPTFLLTIYGEKKNVNFSLPYMKTQMGYILFLILQVL